MEMLSNYPSSWQRVDTELAIWRGHVWREFHRAWWGPAGRKRLDEVRSKPEAERFLHVRPESIFTALTGRQQPCRGILVRRDYDDLLSHLRAGHQDDLSGVILVGLPGSGKTCFNIFVLLECMAQSQNIMFTTLRSETLLFDEAGVWKKHTEDVSKWDLPPFDIRVPTSRVWSIIDGYWGMDSPPFALYGLACFALYPIPSPCEERFRRWFKDSSPRVWTMKPWLGIELFSVILQNGYGNALVQDEHALSVATILQYVERIRCVAGPVPRDIFSYLQDHVLSLQAVRKAVSVTQADPSLPGSLSIDWNSVATFDKLLLLRPVGEYFSNQDGEYAVDFRSTTVASIVRAHARLPDFNTAEEAFRRANESVTTNALAAWAFDALAILCTSAPIPPRHDLMALEMEAGLHLMFRDPSTTATRPRFIYGQREDEDVLTISPEGSVLLPRGNVACISQATEYLILPVLPREITPFSDLAREVALDATRYFVSAQRDQLFFDAFFFEERPLLDGKNIVNIWVFRTWLAKAEGDQAASSVELLRTLRMKVLATGLFPVLKYVVVVPLQVRQTVVWDFPADWPDDVQGEVYVQFLDPLMNKGEREQLYTY